MNKTKRVNFRITEKELQKIKEKAKKSNMNLTKYLTVCALKKDIVVIENLKEFQVELRRIGNNLNQLTRLCNEGIITCLELENIKKQVNEIWQLLNLLTQNQA